MINHLAGMNAADHMTADRITQLAIAALLAADTAKEAKREFADAVAACVDHHKSDEVQTFWKVRRLSGEDPFSGAWKTRWVDAEGRDANDAPEVIRNREAWQRLRDAKKAAGAAKGRLTRAPRRVMRESGTAADS